MKNIFTVLILSFFYINIYAQDNSYARYIIDTLCSKEMYGRGYIKNGDQKAANFIKHEFKKIGLTKIEKRYYQKFSFNINTYESEQALTINKKKLSLGAEYILSPNTGSGIGKVKTLNFNQFLKKENVSKKGIILSLDEYMQVFKNSQLTEKALSSKIIIKQNSTKLTAALAHYNLPIPVVEVLDSSNSKIKRVRFDIKSELKKDYTSQNVIGMIEGTLKSDSSLIICAHYDHLGGMGEVYFPGANDNAAGIAMLLELAKFYKSNPHKHNIVFIAFGGEEAGLLGSKYFVDNKTIELSKIKFLLNIDLVGTGEDGITVVNGDFFKDDFERLNNINKKHNYLPKIKPRGKAANSDHYWFTEKDVPSFFIYTMGSPSHYHDIYDNGNDLGLEKFKEIQKLIIEFY